MFAVTTSGACSKRITGCELTTIDAMDVSELGDWAYNGLSYREANAKTHIKITIADRGADMRRFLNTLGDRLGWMVRNGLSIPHPNYRIDF